MSFTFDSWSDAVRFMEQLVADGYSFDMQYNGMVKILNVIEPNTEKS